MTGGALFAMYARRGLMTVWGCSVKGLSQPWAAIVCWNERQPMPDTRTISNRLPLSMPWHFGPWQTLTPPVESASRKDPCL